MEVHFDRSVKSPSLPASRRNSCSSRSNVDDVFEGYTQGLPGLHEWTSWRTQLNSVMVDLIEERHRIFSYPKSKKYIRHHSRILKTLTEPSIAIGKGVSDFALSRAVHDYVHGEDGFHLDAESFLSFGIPRVKLRSNMSYSADGELELPTSPNSIRATDGSIDLNKAKELESEILYSESTKRKTKNSNSTVNDQESNASSVPTLELAENGVYL